MHENENNNQGTHLSPITHIKIFYTALNSYVQLKGCKIL